MNVLFRNFQRTSNDLKLTPKPRVVSLVKVTTANRRLASYALVSLIASAISIAATALWFNATIAPQHLADTAIKPLSVKTDLPKPPNNKALSDIILPAEALSPEVPTAPEIPANPAINIVASKLSDLPVLRGQSDRVKVNASAVGARSNEALLEEAVQSLQSNDFEAALAFYRQVLDTDPANHTALSGKAYALGQSGDYTGAALVGRQLLRLYPQDKVAKQNLIAALGQSVAPETEEQLQRLADASPGDGSLQIAYAHRLLREGDTDNALLRFDRAVRDDPANLSYRLELAIIYDRNDHPAEALALYQQILHAASEDEAQPTPLAMPLSVIKQRVAYLAARAAYESYSRAQ